MQKKKIVEKDYQKRPLKSSIEGILVSGKDKGRVMFKIKTAAIIVIVLLAIFGVQQVLRRHATASYTDIFNKKEYQAKNRPAHFLSPEKNDLYESRCGTCHFLFRPGLMTSKSWVRIVEESAEHFGKNLSLDQSEKIELLTFLTKNSADEGWLDVPDEIGETAVILLEQKMGQNNNAPVRVTQTRYIKEAHNMIDPTVFDRKAVGGFNNCGGCHERP